MTLIAIEGIDGSGKATQTEILSHRLNTYGTNATTMSFPAYRATFAGALIGKYLDGKLGPLNAVDPRLIAMMYAMDRLESRTELEMRLSAHDVVICDRYFESNIAYQGAKQQNPLERKILSDWIRNLETKALRAVKPDMTILLEIPVQLARQRVAMKNGRSYTNKTADLHESNLDYLSAARDCYHEIAEQPHWRIVSVLKPDGTEKGRHEIAEEVHQHARSLPGGPHAANPFSRIDRDGIMKAILTSDFLRNCDAAVAAESIATCVMRELGSQLLGPKRTV